MIDKIQTLNDLKQTGIIAVLRVDSSNKLLKVSDALLSGGVKFIEFTMTTPSAIEMVFRASEKLGSDAYIGVGTVLDTQSANQAIDAGAKFIVSPIYDHDIVSIVNKHNNLVIPGAFTPQEIYNAWNGGADIVKVFPANIGKANYFKDLKGPFPLINILPTGGVDLETAPLFINNGAYAVAVGKALVGTKFDSEDDFAAITKRARSFIEIVKMARN